MSKIALRCSRIILVTMAALAGFSGNQAIGSSASTQSDVVALKDGRIKGVDSDGFQAFKGIPFAAPPVGPLRWRAPQPARPWNNVLDAKAFAPDCMQKEDRSNSNVGIPLLRTTPSEDCLYLNVWRPAETAAKPLPVMVWFYGGGFSVGGTSPILFQGDSFARKGVIFVSFNYRLGRFGFFAHPALSQEHPNEPKGNYAFLDQIAALKWIQRNIGAFGGDPKNVTIFGESAGGVAVNAMLVSPLARGLFQKAILESGVTHGLAVRELDKDQTGRLSLEKYGLAFAASKGIAGTGKDAVARLRALPPSELIDLSVGLPQGGDRSRTPWGGPTMDGKILPVIRGDHYRMGSFAPVPLMVGANSDDVTASTGADQPRSVDYTLARFGPDRDSARRVYDPWNDGDPRVIRHRVAADDHMIEPSRFIANEFAARQVPVYRYYFTYVPDAMRERWVFGAPHGSELAFVFNVLRMNYGPAWTDRDLKLADLMNSYWVNFARTGNPNGPDLPEWPRYAADSDQLMLFARDGSAVATVDPLKARLDLAAKVAEPRRNGKGETDPKLPKWPNYEPVE